MAVPKRRVSKTESSIEKNYRYKLRLPRPVQDRDGTWRMPHHMNLATGEYRIAK